MALDVEIPGRETLSLTELLLDMNGTLTDRGELLPGVADRLSTVRAVLRIHLLTADTYGTAGTVGRELDVSVARVADGDDKRRYVERLGAERCAAIGNGANDVPMLGSAAVGIAVLGPEGASSGALAAADAVCRSIGEALRLLVDPLALAATLRA